MTVYHTAEQRDTDDGVRFLNSVQALEKAGISVNTVLCASEDDVPEGDIRDSHESGDMLPAAEYEGVAVCVGRYPTDQELADYLEVPDGVLSVDRSRGPAMANDLPAACGIRARF